MPIACAMSQTLRHDQTALRNGWRALLTRVDVQPTGFVSKGIRQTESMNISASTKRSNDELVQDAPLACLLKGVFGPRKQLREKEAVGLLCMPFTERMDRHLGALFA